MNKAKEVENLNIFMKKRVHLHEKAPVVPHSVRTNEKNHLSLIEKPK